VVEVGNCLLFLRQKSDEAEAKAQNSGRMQMRATVVTLAPASSLKAFLQTDLAGPTSFLRLGRLDLHIIRTSRKWIPFSGMPWRLQLSQPFLSFLHGEACSLNALSAAVQTFEGHSGPVASFAFSPDGTQVISGSYDTRVWPRTRSPAHCCRRLRVSWLGLHH
jgi:WD40 repeat protein